MRVGLAALMTSILLHSMDTTYTINFFDCNNPIKVSTYQKTTTCNQDPTPPETSPIKYNLLQT